MQYLTCEFSLAFEDNIKTVYNYRKTKTHLCFNTKFTPNLLDRRQENKRCSFGEMTLPLLTLVSIIVSNPLYSYGISVVI